MKLEPVDPNYERRVRESFARQAFMGFIGAELTDVAPGRCTIEVSHRVDLTQQHGFFHAGVVGSIADSAGGYAAYTLMPAESSVLSVEYKLNLLKPADGDRLVATAEVVRSGQTLTICAARMSVRKGNESKLCATALMTMMAMHGHADRSTEPT